MKTLLILSLVCFLGPVEDAASADADELQVLVLVNDATLVGKIHKDGDKYVVVRTAGETRIPASQVIRLCRSRAEAYRVLRQRANLRDADEHYRLAKWCWRHGLTELARNEAEEAIALRPRHAPARSLLRSIRFAEQRTQSSSTGTLPKPARLVKPQPPPRPPQPEQPPSVPYSAETLVTFTRYVQPILLNRCGTGACHGGSHATGFSLVRQYPYARTTAVGTKRNLLIALGLIDAAAPADSPILHKALQAHGGAEQPPLSSDSPAFRRLHGWVMEAAKALPRPKRPAGFQSKSEPVQAGAGSFAGSGISGGFATAADRYDGAGSSASQTTPMDNRNAAPKPATSAPNIKRQDPFDPTPFNRRYHPDRN